MSKGQGDRRSAKKPGQSNRNVGDMQAPPVARVPVPKTVGRHQARVYCSYCGAKRTKEGDCPRGHPV